MSSSFPWIEGLQLSKAEVEQWHKSLPPGENFLFWCLVTGKINPPLYLLWARDHYNIPILDDEYIKTQFDTNLWNQLKDINAWSEKLFPVGEWDGVIFLACVEPTDSIQWSFSVQYVLSSPELMQETWHKLNSVPAEEPAAFAAVHESQTITPAHKNEEVIPVVPRPPPDALTAEAFPTDFQAEAVVEEPVAEEAGPPPEMDMPEGLSLSAGSDVPKSDLDFNMGRAFNDIAKEPSEEEPTNLDDGAPSGFSASSSAMNFNFDKLLSTPSVSEAKPSEPTPAPEAAAPQPKAPSPQPATPKATPKPVATPTPVAAKPTPPPAAPKPSVAASASDEKDPLDYETLEQTKNKARPVAVVSQFFDDMHQHFKSCMILLMKNGKLKPWRWSPDWNPTSEIAVEPFDFLEPSLFRIVCTTKNPFHGPVVLVPSNVSFFMGWGLPTPPDHATACALRVGDRVAGLALCIGDKESSSLGILHKVEEATDTLSEHLSDLGTKIG